MLRTGPVRQCSEIGESNMVTKWLFDEDLLMNVDEGAEFCYRMSRRTSEWQFRETAKPDTAPKWLFDEDLLVEDEEAGVVEVQEGAEGDRRVCSNGIGDDDGAAMIVEVHPETVDSNITFDSADSNRLLAVYVDGGQRQDVADPASNPVNANATNEFNLAAPYTPLSDRSGSPILSCESDCEFGASASTSKLIAMGRERFTEVCPTDDSVPDELARQIRKITLARHERKASRFRAGDEQEQTSFDDEYEGTFGLFGGDKSDLYFEWYPMETYVGVREEFCPQQTPGPTVAVESVYDAFRYFWDDSIMTHIVTETNKYAILIKDTSQDFADTWYDTNVDEIMVLFCFWMMLAIVRMPSIKSCFSQHPLLKVDVFSSMFSLKRFYNLNRAFHLVDISSRNPESSDLFFFGPVLDHVIGRFQSAYVLSQNVCIDENRAFMKGNLLFGQYEGFEDTSITLKTLELCESSTGYVWSIAIYASKDATNSSTGIPKSTEAVLSLVRPLLNKGHTLYMDSYSNSPALARFLKRNGTDFVGTLRPNRVDVPPIIAMAKLKPGEYIARHSGDITVLAFQDKKKITMMTTWHGNKLGVSVTKHSRPSQCKPQAVLDYNKEINGIDTKDQMLDGYPIERKKRSWYKKYFIRLLNYSIHNTRILCSQCPRYKTADHLGFRLNLITEILAKHQEGVPKLPRSRSRPIPIPSAPTSIPPNTAVPVLTSALLSALASTPTPVDPSVASAIVAALAPSLISDSAPASASTQPSSTTSTPSSVTAPNRTPAAASAICSDVSTWHFPRSFPSNGKEGKLSRTLRKLCVRCLQQKMRTLTTSYCSICSVPLCPCCYEQYHIEIYS